jgi:chromosome segregation ATPase
MLEKSAECISLRCRLVSGQESRMSTLGKVLCVLVALAVLPWLWLASGVADLNRNWGKREVELNDQIAKAAGDIATTRTEIRDFKNRIDLAQRERDMRLRTVRAELSQLLKRESYSKETLDRFTLQRSGVERDHEGAQRQLESRTQELADTRKAMADAQGELAQLKEENTRDRAHLADLRKQFQTTLEENRSLVENARARQDRAQSSLPRSISLAR